MSRFSCIILYIIGLLLPVLSVSQVKAPLTRAQIDSIVNPKPLVNGDSFIQLNTNCIDIGIVNDNDSPIECTFRIKNVTNNRLNLTQIKTTCGCTVAKFNTSLLNSGEEREVTLTYSPQGEEGDIDVKGYLYTEISATQPTAVVHLTGKVKSSDKWRHLPYRIGELRVKRKRVSFEAIEQGMKPTMAILCANSGTAPLKIYATDLPQYATFKCEPAVLEPNCEGELLITIDGSLLPDRESALQFSFIINGTEAQQIEKNIKVTIEK